MSDPLKPVPTQIDSIVGVDRMDKIDRQKLPASVKLRLLCEEAKNTLGQDPRSGHGLVFVGRPRAMLQLLIDMYGGAEILNQIKLERPVIVGSFGADVIGYWMGVPLVVRSNVVDDQIWCVQVHKLPESKMVDRQRAGELRIRAHARTLEELL